MTKNNIDEFLDESDKIAELSDEAVKDIFVRVELWRRYKHKYMNRLGSDAYEQFMSQLKASDGSDNLYNGIREQLGIQEQSRINKSGMSPEDYLWREWTNSDMDESVKVAKARVRLDNMVSGGCGMPIHEIIRDNLEAWKGL